MAESDKFWDKTAERYAKSAVSDEATYNKKLAETQGFLSPDMRVVEFGCGTGTTAIHHAPHVTHVDAIDISANMLEIGRGKAELSSVRPGAATQLGGDWQLMALTGTRSHSGIGSNAQRCTGLSRP